MAKISLKFHEETLQEFPLSESPVSVGRTDENEIVIKNLGVSRKHAQITKEDRDYFLEDMGSRNGTILNDKAIDKKTKLQDQDKITIGKHHLIFFLHEDQSFSTSSSSTHETNRFLPPDETMRISSVKMKKETSAFREIKTTAIKNPDSAESKNYGAQMLDIKPTAIEPTRKKTSSPLEEKIKTQKMQGGVEILKGGIKQNKIKFDRLLIVAGKGASADIRIKGEYEKDVVFIISTRNTGYFISPPKGIPLTVNGKEIHDYTKLDPGDIIQAGETSMKFFQN